MSGASDRDYFVMKHITRVIEGESTARQVARFLRKEGYFQEDLQSLRKNLEDDLRVLGINPKVDDRRQAALLLVAYQSDPRTCEQIIPYDYSRNLTTGSSR